MDVYSGLGQRDAAFTDGQSKGDSYTLTVNAAKCKCGLPTP